MRDRDADVRAIFWAMVLIFSFQKGTCGTKEDGLGDPTTTFLRVQADWANMLQVCPNLTESLLAESEPQPEKNTPIETPIKPER